MVAVAVTAAVTAAAAGMAAVAAVAVAAVAVAAAAADLESVYTQIEYRDPPGHPWPIYVVLALLAIAL